MEGEVRLGMIVICTGKYHVFLQPLINSMDRYLLSGNYIDLYLLTDNDYLLNTPDRIIKKRFAIPHLPWPYPTLYRYKWITEYADEMTAKNLFYCDVDMLFVNDVGKEILPDENVLVATRHPGFYVNGGWGDHGTKPNSTAYLEPDLRHNYMAGGFQGGARDAYLKCAKELSENISADEVNGILAQWHDESHWNHYLKFNAHNVLSPEYCMVEQRDLRKKWGIDKFTPRLVALAKDHNTFRT